MFSFNGLRKRKSLSFRFPMLDRLQLRPLPDLTEQPENIRGRSTQPDHIRTRSESIDCPIAERRQSRLSAMMSRSRSMNFRTLPDLDFGDFSCDMNSEPAQSYDRSQSAMSRYSEDSARDTQSSFSRRSEDTVRPGTVSSRRSEDTVKETRTNVSRRSKDTVRTQTVLSSRSDDTVREDQSVLSRRSEDTVRPQTVMSMRSEDSVRETTGIKSGRSGNIVRSHSALSRRSEDTYRPSTVMSRRSEDTARRQPVMSRKPQDALKAPSATPSLSPVHIASQLSLSSLAEDGRTVLLSKFAPSISGRSGGRASPIPSIASTMTPSPALTTSTNFSQLVRETETAFEAVNAVLDEIKPTRGGSRGSDPTRPPTPPPKDPARMTKNRRSSAYPPLSGKKSTKSIKARSIRSQKSSKSSKSALPRRKAPTGTKPATSTKLPTSTKSSTAIQPTTASKPAMAGKPASISSPAAAVKLTAATKPIVPPRFSSKRHGRRWHIPETVSDLFSMKLFQKIEADEVVTPRQIEDFKIRKMSIAQAQQEEQARQENEARNSHESLMQPADSVQDQPAKSPPLDSCCVSVCSHRGKDWLDDVASSASSSRHCSPRISSDVEDGMTFFDDITPSRCHTPASSIGSPPPTPPTKHPRRLGNAKKLSPLLDTLPEHFEASVGVRTPESISSQNSQNFVFLQSTRRSLIGPKICHGPIRVSRQAMLCETLKGLDDGLDWTAFQMAILGGAGDQYSEIEETSRRREAEDVQELLEWWSTWKFESPGALIHSEVEKADPLAQPSNSSGSQRSSIESSGSSGSSASLSDGSDDVDDEDELRDDLAAYSLSPTNPFSAQHQWKPLGQTEAGDAATTMNTTTTMHLEVDTSKQATILDQTSPGNIDKNVQVVPSSSPDSIIEMGCNLNADLDDFLRWEAEHTYAANFYSGPFRC